MRILARSWLVFFLVGCGRSLPVQTDENDPTVEDAGTYVCSPPWVDTSGDVVPPWAVGIFHWRPGGPNPAFNLRISGSGDFVWETGSFNDAPSICDSYGGEHGIARVVDGGVALFPALDGGNKIFWNDSNGGVLDVTTVTITPADGGVEAASELGTALYVTGADCGCLRFVACPCDPFEYYAGN